MYRRFDAASVGLALKHAVENELFAENPTIMLMFVRIAEVYPETRDQLQKQKLDAGKSERQAIELVLDPPEEVKQARYLPETIASPGEMDLCWAEFLVTGETQSVEKIVAVLDEEDRTRAFLNEQLASGFELSEAERLELQTVGIGIGKYSDELGWDIMTPGDTDVFLWLGLKDGNGACQKIFAAMNESIQLGIACKGAALWSLQANASQHGKIRLVCQEAAEVPGGFARKLLNQ